MAKRCIQKIFERIIVSLSVILCMQLPFFVIQYTHQLKGHLDELGWQVEQMERSALFSGKNLDQYISKFTQNSDSDFANQGIMMRAVTHRFKKLSQAWIELNKSSSLNTPFCVFFVVYSFWFKRTQKDHIESSLQLKKKSGLILNSILTPIFYSIVEALNEVFLGAIEPERVYAIRHFLCDPEPF